MLNAVNLGDMHVGINLGDMHVGINLGDMHVRWYACWDQSRWYACWDQWLGREFTQMMMTSHISCQVRCRDRPQGAEGSQREAAETGRRDQEEKRGQRWGHNYNEAHSCTLSALQRRHQWRRHQDMWRSWSPRLWRTSRYLLPLPAQSTSLFLHPLSIVSVTPILPLLP